MNIKVNASIRHKGGYKVYKNGELVFENDNLLTDGFFQRFCDGDTAGNFRFYLGDSAALVAKTDIGIGGFITNSMSTNKALTSSAGEVNKQDGDDYWIGKQASHQYLPGVFTGTVRQLGIRCHTSTAAATTNGDVLDSLVNIRDQFGDLAGIIIGAEDTITVYYTILMLMPRDIAYDTILETVKTRITFQCMHWAQGNGIIAVTRGQGWLGGGSGSNNNLTAYDGPNRTLATTPTATGFPGTGASATTQGATNSVLSNTATTITVNYAVTLTSTYRLGANGLQATLFKSASPYFGWHYDPPIKTVAGGMNMTVVWTLNPSVDFVEILPVGVIGNLSTITETTANGVYTTYGIAGAYPTGGQEPFTYAWALQSAAASTPLTATDPTKSSTQFTANGTSETSVETWRCTITDAALDTDFFDVVVSVTWS